MRFQAMEMPFNHPLTGKGIDQFMKDWNQAFQETAAVR